MTTPRALGEIAAIVRGISFPKEAKSHKPRPGDVVCLRTTNVQRQVEWDDLWFVPVQHVKRDEQYVKPGDILISTANSYELVGKVALVAGMPRPATLGAFISLIRAGEEVDPKFLYHQLAWGKTQSRIRETASTTTNISNVSTKKLSGLELLVPPLGDQHRIVAEIEKQFSRLDEAVAILKRAEANLKRYKAAVLNAAVEGRLVATEADLARREDRNYETGDQLLEQIRSLRRAKSKGKGLLAESTTVDVELPLLPAGWAWARLDAIAELKGGITVDKKRNDATAREVPYLRVANVQRGYLNLSEVKTIRASEADISSLALRAGDILFNEGGDRDKLGRGWVWEGQIAECIHQNHVFRARPLLDTLSPRFISWWGNTFGKDRFLREGKQTTNLASVSLTKLSRFPVPIPPALEQARITAEAARLLSIIDRLESALGVNLARASSLMAAVLSKAFRSGAKSEVAEIKSSVNEGETSMQKRALPQLPPPRASEAEDDRQDLLGVLARYSEGIAVERLLVDSGYKGDQVDQFYRDLARLNELIEVTVPEDPMRTWPFVQPATVRLRRKG